MEELLGHKPLNMGVEKACWGGGSVMNQNGGYKRGAGDDQYANTAAPGFYPQARPGGSCQGEASWARLSLPLSVRAGQWCWGRWRGRGRGRCRGLRGRGLRERRHRNMSADSETKSSPGRQPLGTPLDGRMPLQVGDGRSGDRQPDSSGQSGAWALSHTPPHTKPSTRATWNDIVSFTQAVIRYENSANADSSASACMYVFCIWLCVHVCATIVYSHALIQYCKYL